MKPWAEDEKIYCLREAKVFRSNLEGVACERFFYKVDGLSPDEIKLIEQVIIEQSPEYSKTAIRRFLTLYSLAPELKRLYSDRLAPDSLSNLDDLIANFSEDYHEKIENKLLVFLNSMLAGNIDFYSDRKQAGDFLYAICLQYTRTKQVREALLSQIGTTFIGCDVKRLFGPLSHIIAMKLAESLYCDRQRFTVILIDNSTDTPFLAADQPIVNLHATFDGKPPERIEFFYPLSPAKAMLLVDSPNGADQQPISAVSVNRYNVLMIQNSHEQVFSNSGEYLASIAPVTRNKLGA